ncbi:sulfurtransferase TusA family protein [Bowmanella dokdonensis]|uniref:Sulfurtransferase TusA family protein n=1 Tax=Bowmanella dokdonensis TaxID=751969 RepID=A0A939DKU9_9ALTE|nr:sulfurtransferase TusA family protein [Bowmanella dokdonensis]MBN7824409.1 sulfurtransferase TusA family protein [Bowmanella dokdonensis]
MQALDISELTCPLALLEVKRWLAGQSPGRQLTLILRHASADNQDVIRWLSSRGISASSQSMIAGRLYFHFTHKDI